MKVWAIALGFVVGLLVWREPFLVFKNQKRVPPSYERANS